jgi:hypothetical protein
MRKRLILVLTVLLGISPLARHGAGAQTFSSGSTGADGAFAPTGNTTVTLPPNGILNFTTVHVPQGVTVRFSRNATNTPATLLASGNVTIEGTIDVAGSPGGDGGQGIGVTTNGGTGGPGGLDGGAGATGLVSVTGGTGRGPGGGTGGTAGSSRTAAGGGGGFQGTGGNGSADPNNTPGVGGPAYGDSTLLPLVGGSGGGGGGSTLGYTAGGGGGGGGALLIASSGTLTFGASGRIDARGGAGGSGGGAGPGGGGSGGAVRIVATTIVGAGNIDVSGRPGGSYYTTGGPGAAGRVRIEAHSSTGTINISGVPPASISMSSPTIVALAATPMVQIASIGGITAPASPTASFGVPDVVLPASTANPVAVTVTAANIPVGTVISVTVSGQNGGGSATESTALAGTLASSTATATISVPLNQPSVITASATFALASLGQAPVCADGEEVEHVRVTAGHGGSSKLAYVTRSGREVAFTAR